MKRRTMFVAMAVLQIAVVAHALPPRNTAKSRSNPRQTSRPTMNLGSSPSLSAKSSAARSTMRRPPANTRPSIVTGNVNNVDRRPNRPPMTRPGNLPGNRPVYDLRPNYGYPSYGNSSGIGSTVVGNNNVVNNTIINNNNYGNQQINNRRRNRPYYSDLHQHWRPTGWNSYRPAYGNYYGYQTSGSIVSVGGLQVGYANPFYVQPTTVAVGLDYSQPIHVPAADYRETNDDLVRSEQAVRRFDEARELFRRGDYARANTLVDDAIRLLPNDPTLHQFRALVLFARGQYEDAAAAIYSVLAVDSGWTRDTLSQLYDDPQRYEEQFRDLQRYAAANPTAIDARFLLAYHYLMLGELEKAAKNLEVVRIAKPDDRVTLNLLSAIRS
jgi:hypothetical protein